MGTISDQRTQAAFDLFAAGASSEKYVSQRELYGALHDLALSVQDAMRMLAALRTQVEEIRGQMSPPRS